MKTPLGYGMLLLLLSLVSFGGRAQIVNKGQVYISKDTQYSAHADFTNKGTGKFYNDGQAYFFQDFTNNGRYDFTDTTGHSYFTGEGLQLLQGSKKSFFYKLTFDNPGQLIPFHLKGDFVIEHRAYFNDGIIDNRQFGGTMTFLNKAMAVNASDASFVDGTVTRIGKAPFVYPIGDDFYRFAGTEGTTIHNVFKATYFHENPSFQYPVTAKTPDLLQIDNREYWTITKPQTQGETSLITLSYSNSTTPQDFIDAAQNKALVIARWDAANQKWVNESGTVDLSNNTVSAAVNEYGVFTLATTAVVTTCPIEVNNYIDISGVTRNTHMHITSACADIISVMVFNRWGIKVFETTDYGLSGDVFDGYSSGRLTLNRNTHLPAGTYFYIINYKYNTPTKTIRKQKVGYVYIGSGH